MLGSGSGWFGNDFTTTCLNDANCAQYVSIASGHGYGYPFTPTAYPLCTNNPTKCRLWLSETGDQSTPYNATIAEGITWAKNINDFLTVASVSGIEWWELAYNSSASVVPNGGLTDQAFVPAKRFYTEGNWSKFVRPGWIRLDSPGSPAGVSVTAFKDPLSLNFVIVAVNQNGSGTPTTFTLSNFPAISNNQVTPFITDATRNIAQLANVNVTGATFSYTLPATSVTTFTGVISPGATYNATSCAQSGAGSLGALIAAAADGDTINGPVGGGTATWTSAVSSSHTNLLINGNGCNITIAGSDIFNLTWTNQAVTPRITNFTINGYAGGAIFTINGNVSAFRIDHITINAATPVGNCTTGNPCNPYFIWFGHGSFDRLYKDLSGLVDHITYNCTSDNTCDAFLFYGRDWNWLSPHTMGTVNAIYIEDSSFTCSACTGQHFNTVTDAQHGARFVVRHNTMQNMSISEHDVGVGLDRGTRQYEVYNNTFTCRGSASASCFNALAVRGGTNLIFNNTLQMDASNGLSGWGVVAFSEIFRLADPGCGQIPWNGIRVANPDVILAPGNDPSGTCGGSVLPGPSTGGVCSDFYPHNQTSPFAWCSAQGGSCDANPPISGGQCGTAIYSGLPDYTGGSVTNTLLTQIDGTGVGGYPARDQSAAGPDQGANHTQVGAAEPLYIFNNICGANSASCTQGSTITNPYTNGVNIGSFITNNRDVYLDAGGVGNGTVGVGVGTLAQRPATCTAGVGYWATNASTLYQCAAGNIWTTYYTPLTYPHPLQGGGGVPVPAWTGTFNFGNQNINTSAQLVETLSNNGPASPVMKISITVAGTGFSHAAGGTCDNLTTLAGGTSCTTIVQFTPTSAITYSGSLTETDSTNNVSAVATLSGTGIAPAAASFNPTSVAFGGQAQSTTSVPIQVTLTNSGGSQLALGTPFFSAFTGTNSGDFAVVTPSAPTWTVTQSPSNYTCGTGTTPVAPGTFTCNISGLTIGAGHGLLLMSSVWAHGNTGGSGNQPTHNAPTGDGDTWVLCPSFLAHEFNSGNEWSLVDCYYVASATGGSGKTITDSWTTSGWTTGKINFDMKLYEFSPSVGAIIVDGTPAPVTSSSCATCVTGAVTITGTSDIAFQTISSADTNSITGISGGYTADVTDASNVIGAFAYKTNVSSVPSVNWTLNGASSSALSTIAFSSTGVPSACSPGLILQPTQFCNFQLTFTPATNGAESATFNLSANSNTQFATLSLTGTGVGTPQAATPVYNPLGGTYTSTQNPTITSGTAGATICYRTDGGTPTAGTPGTCDAPATTLTNGNSITVSSSETVNAIATKAAFVNSSVGVAVYVIQTQVNTVLAPISSLAAGGWVGAQNPALSSGTNGAKICYRLDGGTPTAATAGTCDSPAISLTNGSTFALTTSATLTMIGTLAGNLNSTVVTYPYQLFSAAPSLTPGPNVYLNNTTVTVTFSNTTGSSMCYTTDGSNPLGSGGTCVHGTLIANNGMIAVTPPQLVLAISTDPLLLTSGIAGGIYTPAIPNPKMTLFLGP
jgi:hypothetical protein